METWKRRRLLRSAKLAMIVVATAYTSIGISLFMADAGKREMQEPVVDVATVTGPNIQEPSGTGACMEVNIQVQESEIIHSLDWGAEDSYLLAKLAMAEAEGEDTKGKALVMLVVLNRVWSEGFPNTIEDVILEEHNGVHQFSVTQEGGRWYTVEPDEDCYNALELITLEHWDESEGALYFESRSDSTWHQNNLQFLFKHGKHYFYKEG